MKVRLDEGVPRRLVTALTDLGIDASRFPREWFGMRNGQLIALLEKLGISVLLTNDKNIANQQNLSGRSLAIVALPHNRQPDILQRADDIADTILRARPGQHVLMAWDGSRTVIEIVDGRAVQTTMPPVRPFARR